MHKTTFALLAFGLVVGAPATAYTIDPPTPSLPPVENWYQDTWGGPIGAQLEALLDATGIELEGQAKTDFEALVELLSVGEVNLLAGYSQNGDGGPIDATVEGCKGDFSCGGTHIEHNAKTTYYSYNYEIEWNGDYTACSYNEVILNVGLVDAEFCYIAQGSATIDVRTNDDGDGEGGSSDPGFVVELNVALAAKN